MLQVILNNARSFGGFEAITSSADAEVWRHIVDSYSQRTFRDREGRTISIAIDWSARMRYEESYCEFFNRPPLDIASALVSDKFKFERAHVCPVDLTIDGREPERVWSGNEHLQRMLHDTFVIANLSAPGSFNLYRSYVRNTSLDPTEDPMAQTELELSEYPFEISWHLAQDKPWLKVGFTSFDVTRNWYESLDLHNQNIGRGAIDRTIFCLLHLSKSSFMEAPATLWIASALESFYDTPNGAAFAALCQRVSSLLQLQQAEEAELRRKMREFFDIRNAFAHGGSNVCHPLADERDARVEKLVNENMAANNFACAVLLGSIQEVVRRGWKEIGFIERVEPIASNAKRRRPSAV